MDITASVALVEENGSELEKARLRQILYAVKPPPEVIHDLVQRQNEDGGFPYGQFQGNPSTVNSTLVALWWLDELGMLASAPAGEALGYLLAAQREDGGWDEDPAAAKFDLPPWISPGDLRTRLYLTAYAAYWLALSGDRARPGLRKALDFLLRHQDRAGKFYGYLHTTWIATSVFIVMGERYTEVAAKGLQVLMGRPLAEWADSQISWALDCLGRAGLPKGHPFVEQGLTELLRRRDPAGSWSSEDGEAHTVDAIIGVLKVFKLYGRLPA
jgi:squalene cyclase